MDVRGEIEALLFPQGGTVCLWCGSKFSLSAAIHVFKFTEERCMCEACLFGLFNPRK